MEDKLDRLAALRPLVRSSPAVSRLTGRENCGRLMELLGAEARCTSLGQHIGVRHRFAEPSASSPSLKALRMLAPQFAEEALDPTQWIFLDTETTGLSGGTGTYAFLVGVAWWDESSFVIDQLFMRDHSEEPSLLLELRDLLDGRRVMVTFNGKSFDWPLLETRFRMTRVARLLQPALHLDLLHPSRRLWRWRLPSVALSELERHILLMDRGPDIPSATIPVRYFDFLRGGPAEPMVEVFRHNQMDLLGLAKLMVEIILRLEEPGKHNPDGTELFGISRLLNQRGEIPLASVLLERALAEGLPEPVGRAAQHELALLAKRRCEYDRAEGLWRELAGETHEGLQAFEELAKHYEHRLKQPQTAAVWVRQALVRLREGWQTGRISSRDYRRWHARFQHRLQRLERF